jgi:hypothetical protein
MLKRSLTLGVAMTIFSVIPVEAQPRALFQWGTPSGTESKMNVSRVPVVDAAGNIRYFDVAIAFNVDGAGKLTLNSTASKITASPTLTVGAFRPGTYLGGSFTCEHVVGTPGVAGGGRISGSIAQSNCGVTFNASWVNGPIAGHPNEGALRAAAITFQGYAWGVLGEVSSGWQERGWKPGRPSRRRAVGTAADPS